MTTVPVPIVAGVFEFQRFSSGDTFWTMDDVMPFVGTIAAFRKVYEEPIIMSRQPNCVAEDKALGECRATEVGTVHRLIFSAL